MTALSLCLGSGIETVTTPKCGLVPPAACEGQHTLACLHVLKGYWQNGSPGEGKEVYVIRSVFSHDKSRDNFKKWLICQDNFRNVPLGWRKLYTDINIEDKVSSKLIS